MKISTVLAAGLLLAGPAWAGDQPVHVPVLPPVFDGFVFDFSGYDARGFPIYTLNTGLSSGLGDAVGGGASFEGYTQTGEPIWVFDLVMPATPTSGDATGPSAGAPDRGRVVLAGSPGGTDSLYARVLAEARERGLR